jgi:hypothetical protein
MASTNSNRPTERLSRSASERPAKASSSHTERGKDKLPQAKIQALEQFVKFGRKGKQKEETQRTTEVWPNPTLLPTDTIVPSPLIAADSGVGHRVSRRQTPHRTNSTTQISRPMPEVPLNTSSPGMAELGTDTLDVTSPQGGANPSPLIPGAQGENPLLPTTGTGGETSSNPGAPDMEEQIAPEPLTLARRIRAMLSLRTTPPTPSATDATTSGAGSSEAAAPITPGSSIPPAPVSDSRFFALLGNTNVMSGSTDKRQSVFEILDRIRRPSGRAMEASNDLQSSVSEEEQENEEYESYDDSSSIMLYGPLVPSEDSEVELAASDIMSVFDDGETLEFERPARPLSFFDVGEQFTPRSPPASLLPETPEERHTQEAPTDDSQPGPQKARSLGMV